MPSSRCLLPRGLAPALPALCLLAASGGAAASPIAAADKTYGVLYADQTRDQVLMTRDLDGDGNADRPGEARVFFDAGNASGLANPTRNVFALHQAGDRSILVGDGDTDTVYRLRDHNRNGNANDAGEAQVWFSAAGNAGGFTLPTPNGLAETDDGGIFIVNAGTAPFPRDAVYLTRDLDGDGSANGAGEASVWLDLGAVSATSSAFAMAFQGGAAYVVDQNGGAPDTVWVARDLNGDGNANGAGEVGVFIDDTNPFGVPIGLTVAASPRGVYVMDWFDFTDGHVDSIFRLTDLNGNWAIDDSAEAVQVWTEAMLPLGTLFDVGFWLDVGPNEDLLLSLNSGEAGGRTVVRLRDLDGDGLYLSPGETLVWGSATEHGGFVERARVGVFVTSVPTPPAALLLATGLLGLAATRRRRPRRTGQVAHPAPTARRRGRPLWAGLSLVLVGAGPLAQADQALATTSGCLVCHQVEAKVIGPSYKEVAARYRGDAAAPAMLEAKVKNGGVGTWGQVPMPPHPQLDPDTINQLIAWVLSR